MITNEIATNPLRIVDTLCVVWRNNSENVEYYAVIEVTNESDILIRQIDKFVKDDDYSDGYRPVHGSYIGNVIRAYIDNNECVHITNRAVAHKIDNLVK